MDQANLPSSLVIEALRSFGVASYELGTRSTLESSASDDHFVKEKMRIQLWDEELLPILLGRKSEPEEVREVTNYGCER